MHEAAAAAAAQVSPPMPRFVLMGIIDEELRRAGRVMVEVRIGAPCLCGGERRMVCLVDVDSKQGCLRAILCAFDAETVQSIRELVAALPGGEDVH